MLKESVIVIGQRWKSEATSDFLCMLSHSDVTDSLRSHGLAHGLLPIFQQEYWSRLSLPPPGDLPDPGIEPESPALQADSLLLSHQGSDLRLQR